MQVTFSNLSKMILIHKEPLSIFPRRYAFLLREAGGKVGRMVESDLLCDTTDIEIRLHQQHLGLLDPVALQIFNRRAAEFLLHAARNIHRVKVDAVTKLLHLEFLTIMLPQISCGPFGASGRRRGYRRIECGGQLFNELLKNHLLPP